MESQPGQPGILVLHDGELDDVLVLLGEMQQPCRERRGAPGPEELEGTWAIVVASPQRLLEMAEALGRAPTRSVAILEGESRTLRAALRRAGVDFAVRRPFHPEALRLLFRHALYKGPEKRRQPRVSVGAAVRLRVGWRRHGAVLAELSTTGCRVLTELRLKQGDSVSVQLPPEVAGGRTLRLRGIVMRREAEVGEGSSRVFGVSFAALQGRTRARLAEIVTRHQRGPAQCRGAASEEAEGEPERRGEQRRELERHIPALAEDKAPVLMGRDVSTGGMRVDAHPALSLGDELRIAMHVRARQEPLVVWARVARSDGPDGFALEFFDLSDAEQGYLAKMVKFLPIMARGGDDREAGVVFSEILSHGSGAPSQAH